MVTATCYHMNVCCVKSETVAVIVYRYCIGMLPLLYRTVTVIGGDHSFLL